MRCDGGVVVVDGIAVPLVIAVGFRFVLVSIIDGIIPRILIALESG